MFFDDNVNDKTDAVWQSMIFILLVRAITTKYYKFTNLTYMILWVFLMNKVCCALVSFFRGCGAKWHSAKNIAQYMVSAQENEWKDVDYEVCTLVRAICRVSVHGVNKRFASNVKPFAIVLSENLQQMAKRN